MKYLFLLTLLFWQLCVFSQDHIRFRASIDAAKGFGQRIDGGSQTIGNGIATFTAGLVKKGIFLGAGTGLFKMDGTKTHDNYVAVYGELSYLAKGSKAEPYFSVKIGKLIPNKEAGNPYPELNKSTMMYHPSIGLAIDLKAIYLMPFMEYLVPADFDSRYDSFGLGLRIMSH